MTWILRATVDASHAETACSQLWLLATTGIAISPAPATGVDVEEIVAGFAHHDEAETAASQLHRAGLVVDAAVERYNETSWHHDQDAIVSVAGADGPIELTLEVGPAFGHGRHPTTVVALNLLESVVHPGGQVLDFGAGTGVLTLAAAAMGATHIDGIEHDLEALTVAEANAAHNPHAVTGRTLRWATSLMALESGEHPSPSTPSMRYDVIVANVLLPVHQAHAPDLEARLAEHDDARLIVSGVLATQRDAVQQAYGGLSEVDVIEAGDDWVGMVFARPDQGTRQ